MQFSARDRYNKQCLGNNWVKKKIKNSISTEKDQNVLMDKLNMILWHALTANVVNYIVYYQEYSQHWKERVASTYSALERLNKDYCVQSFVPQYNNTVFILEQLY